MKDKQPEPKLQQQMGKPAPLEIKKSEDGQKTSARRIIDPNLCPNCGFDLLHVRADGAGMKLCPGCRMHVAPVGVELL